MITVANKCDVLNDETVVMGENTVFISARTGYGFEKLLKAISEGLKSTVKRMKLMIPYSETGLLNLIRQKGKVFDEQYEAEGILADALVDITIMDRVKEYSV